MGKSLPSIYRDIHDLTNPSTKQCSMTQAGASPLHYQWPPFEHLSPSINFYVHWWTLANLGQTFKPHFIWWTHFCVSPPETSCLLFDQKTSCFFMDPFPLENSYFRWTQKPHVLWWNHLFVSPPETSCFLSDPKSSCPWPHVFWWTLWVH